MILELNLNWNEDVRVGPRSVASAFSVLAGIGKPNTNSNTVTLTLTLTLSIYLSIYRPLLPSDPQPGGPAGGVRLLSHGQSVDDAPG